MKQSLLEIFSKKSAIFSKAGAMSLNVFLILLFDIVQPLVLFFWKFHSNPRRCGCKCSCPGDRIAWSICKPLGYLRWGFLAVPMRWELRVCCFGCFHFFSALKTLDTVTHGLKPPRFVLSHKWRTRKLVWADPWFPAWLLGACLALWFLLIAVRVYALKFSILVTFLI